MIKTLLLFLCLVVASYADSRRADLVQLINSSNIHGVLPTGSMAPTFDERYYLIVQKLDFQSVELGDVILFEKSGCKTLVVHRVWNKSSGGSVIVTKGDANQLPDQGYVTEHNYVGTVVGIIRADLIKKVLTWQEKVVE